MAVVHDAKTRVSIATVVRKIEAQKARIGKERDRLRDLVDEAESILANCDEADEALTRAVESLSELV